MNDWQNIDLIPPNGMPNNNQIFITYFPMTGGNFLAQVLSCSPSLYGKSHIDFLLNNYEKKLPQWDGYHGNYHSSLYETHTRYFDFDFFNTFPTLVLIDFTETMQENNFISFRLKFHKTSTLHNKHISNIQLRYQRELVKYLDNKNKIYHKFPFTSFLNENKFVLSINSCVKFLNLNSIDNGAVAKLYKNWRSANNRFIN
jgi:hypothetical protein